MAKYPRYHLIENMEPLTLFKQLFYVSNSSPSYLRWKIHVSNRVKEDSIAGCINCSGYWYATYKRIKYPVHSVVYALTFDVYESLMTIDHIDNCPSNNNPNNLRWATKSEQGFNRRKWGFKTMNNHLNSFETSKALLNNI